jgi:hypothetical protein
LATKVDNKGTRPLPLPNYGQQIPRIHLCQNRQ